MSAGPAEPAGRDGKMHRMRSSIVGPVAMFWGLAVFAPVGVNYVAALLLLVALLAAGGLRERAARVRASPLWWPIVAYVAWTLVILAIGPHYPQTPSNLWHGMRIALTMLMALALGRDEAIWAVRGFFVAALASLAMVLLYRTVGFPIWRLWHATLEVDGNKSINNALLFTLFGATAAVAGLAQFSERGAHRPGRALAAFALTAVAGLVITAWLTSRTSLLALLANYNMPHNDFLWMGAQAGFPGALVLLAILLTGLWQGWRRPDLAGRLGFIAMIAMTIATSVNSAMRDAQIGLGMLWVTFVYLRLAHEPGAPWDDLLPARWRRGGGAAAAAALRAQ